jgi:hypothetical protein
LKFRQNFIGIGVALSRLRKRERKAMKPKASENSEVKVATNFVAILGLVTEMARQVNENIARVRLQPLGVSLTESANGVIAPHVNGSKA